MANETLIDISDGDVIWPIPEDVTIKDAICTLFAISDACSDEGLKITNYEADGNTYSSEPRVSLTGFYPDCEYVGCSIGSLITEVLEDDESPICRPPDNDSMSRWSEDREARLVKNRRLLLMLGAAYQKWLSEEASKTFDELMASNADWNDE